MVKFHLLLSGVGFIFCILSMYVFPIFIGDVYSGILGFIGLAMLILAIYLMKKEKR